MREAGASQGGGGEARGPQASTLAGAGGAAAVGIRTPPSWVARWARGMEVMALAGVQRSWWAGAWAAGLGHQEGGLAANIWDEFSQFCLIRGDHQALSWCFRSAGLETGTLTAQKAVAVAASQLC